MSDDDNKIVYLKFNNDKVKPGGGFDVMACSHCNNKTFMLLVESSEDFPVCHCAVCRNRIGKMGFAEEP